MKLAGCIDSTEMDERTSESARGNIIVETRSNGCICIPNTVDLVFSLLFESSRMLSINLLVKEWYCADATPQVSTKGWFGFSLPLSSFSLCGRPEF